MKWQTAVKAITVFTMFFIEIQCLPFIHNKPVNALTCQQQEVEKAIGLIQDGGTAT